MGDTLNEISVIVCSFNPNWASMKFTLDSIVSQKYIDIEIIITDDGSKEDLFPKIKSYFEECTFKNYKLIKNKDNKGTVSNLNSGLLCANGNYAKVISPGDVLVHENVLRNWIDFNNNNNLRWSFSDAIYYIGNHNDYECIRVMAHPQNIDVYNQHNFQKCRWNYVVLDDYALGATMISDTSLLKEYVNKILGKIKYAEDNVWRIMMFDGVVGGYYPQNTILYEFGSGVSTKKNTDWSEKLIKDFRSANEIMFGRDNLDIFQNEIVKACKLKNGNVLNKLFIRGKLQHVLKQKFNKRITEIK